MGDFFKASGRIVLILLLLLTLVLILMAVNLWYSPRGEQVPQEILLLGALLGGVMVSVLLLGGEKGDPLLLAATLFLAITSVFLVWRLNSYLGWRQLFHVAVGVVLYLFLVRFPWNYRILELYTYLAGVGMILAVLITLLFGESVGGQRAWLAWGPFHFEPAELAKILLVLFLAGFLTEARTDLLPSWRYWGPGLTFIAVLELLLIAQKDFGAVVLFFAIFAVMIFLGTGRPAYAWLSLAVAFLAVSVASYYSPHIGQRVATWLNPWPLAEHEGYQMVQNLYALARGGIFGTGLGRGMPGKIPAAATDFIISAAGEEMGLAGAVAIILAEYFLVHRGYMIAAQASHRYGLLLAGGLSSLLAIQDLMILGGVTRLLPLTGITLPFLSYGGSAMVSGFLLLGLLSKISQEERIGRGG